MILSIIVAMGEKRGIGFQNGIPWRLSSDMKRFKSLTMGHHVIMGRKTFHSIGKILPGRKMIVVTHNRAYNALGCSVAYSLDEAISIARSEGETEAFVIGGASLYKAALPQTDRLYLTLVHASTKADVFFPEFEEGEWVETQREEYPSDEKNQYPTTFRILNRKAKN